MTKTTKKAETAAKTETVKAPVAAEPVKAEEKKAVKETKKVATKAAPKTTKTKAAAKTTAKATSKTASTVKVYVEYQGKQMDMDTILEAVKAAAGAKTVKTLEIYVKPEDGAAYYVVNGKDSGKADL